MRAAPKCTSMPPLITELQHRRWGSCHGINSSRIFRRSTMFSAGRKDAVMVNWSSPDREIEAPTCHQLRRYDSVPEIVEKCRLTIEQVRACARIEYAATRSPSNVGGRLRKTPTILLDTSGDKPLLKSQHRRRGLNPCNADARMIAVIADAVIIALRCHAELQKFFTALMRHRPCAVIRALLSHRDSGHYSTGSRDIASSTTITIYIHESDYRRGYVFPTHGHRARGISYIGVQRQATNIMSISFTENRKDDKLPIIS